MASWAPYSGRKPALEGFDYVALGVQSFRKLLDVRNAPRLELEDHVDLAQVDGDALTVMLDPHDACSGFGYPAQQAVELAGSVDFFALRKRPDVAGIRLRDLAGRPADSYTSDEIERAAREGRRLELR